MVYADNGSTVDLSAYSSKNWIKNGGHSWLEFTGDTTVAIVLDSGKSKIEFEIDSLHNDGGNFVYYNTNYDGRDTIVRFEFRSAVKGESDNCLLLVVLGNDAYKFYELDKYMSLTNTSVNVMINDGLAPKSFFNPKDIQDNSFLPKYQGVWRSKASELTIDGDKLEIVHSGWVESYTSRGNWNIDGKDYEQYGLENSEVVTSMRFRFLNESNTILETDNSDWVRTTYYKVGSAAWDSVNELAYKEVDTVNSKFMGEWENSEYRLSIQEDSIHLYSQGRYDEGREQGTSNDDYIIQAHSELTTSQSDSIDYLVFASLSRLNYNVDELRLRIDGGNNLYFKWGKVYEGTFKSYVEPEIYVEPVSYVRPVKTRTIDGHTVTDINMKILVDGNMVDFSDVGPVNVDGSTMVPARAVFEALGLAIDWNGELQRVQIGGYHATSEDFKMDAFVTIDKPWVTTTSGEGTGGLELSVPAMIVDGRTVLPLRALAEGFGYNVAWTDKGTHQEILISVK